MANQPQSASGVPNKIEGSYAGEFAGKYISAAVLSANTLANNGVTVIPNVKFKSVIKRVNNSGQIVTPATCDFTDVGTVSLVERVLTTTEVQVNLQLCKTPFESDWEAVAMGYSAFDNLPSNFTDFFIAKMLKDIALDTENYLWNATNGLGKLLLADSSVVVSSPVAITSANAIAQLQKVVDAIPASLYGREDLRIYVPQNVARAYVGALSGFGASGLGSNGYANQGTMWYTNGTALTIGGVQLFIANGMANNTMIATTIDNLYVGFGLLSDQQEVKVIDMADIDGSKNVRFISRFTRGLQVGVGSDSVTYGIV